MFKLGLVQERVSMLSEDLKVVAAKQKLSLRTKHFSKHFQHLMFSPTQVPILGRMMEEYLLFDLERSVDR